MASVYDLKVRSVKAPSQVTIQFPGDVIPLPNFVPAKKAETIDLRALPKNYYQCAHLDSKLDTLPDGNEVVASVRRCNNDVSKSGGWLCDFHNNVPEGTRKSLHAAWSAKRDLKAEHIDSIRKSENRALNGVEVEKVRLIARDGTYFKTIKGLRMKLDPTTVKVDEVQG